MLHFSLVNPCSDRTGQDTGLDSSLLPLPAAIDSRSHVGDGGDVEDDDNDDDDGDDGSDGKKGYSDSDEVVFKCIGANKQEDRQLVLEELLKDHREGSNCWKMSQFA